MPDFDLFVHNVAEQTSAYDPTKYIDRNFIGKV